MSKRKAKALEGVKIQSCFEQIYQLFNQLFNSNHELENLITEKDQSKMVELIRKRSFEIVKNNEQLAIQNFFENLFSREKITDPSIKELIINFMNKFQSQIYAFNLSLTQSRRSRAGKEFESIIKLIFIKNNIPIENQGIIGVEGIKKKIDFISPSSIHYEINKNQIIFISAKTSLRERWKEVLDEIKDLNTFAIYLFSLDNQLAENLINSCERSHIKLVVLKEAKNKYYSQDPRIISFEELINICKRNQLYWNNYAYSEKEKQQLKEFINQKITKYSQFEIVNNFYFKWLNSILKIT